MGAQHFAVIGGKNENRMLGYSCFIHCILELAHAFVQTENMGIIPCRLLSCLFLLVICYIAT